MKTEAAGHGGYQPQGSWPEEIAKLAKSRPVSMRADVAGHDYGASRPIFGTSGDVSISAGNNSMKLLLKAVAEHVNQALSREFGYDVGRNPSLGGGDLSPQVVADRIVSLSTSFFNEYRDQFPQQDLQTALRAFVGLVGGGIDRGFHETREILCGLGVLKEDVAANIDQTYDYVQAGLKAFVDDPAHGGHGNYSRHGNIPSYGIFAPYDEG